MQRTASQEWLLALAVAAAVAATQRSPESAEQTLSTELAAAGKSGSDEMEPADLMAPLEAAEADRSGRGKTEQLCVLAKMPQTSLSTLVFPMDTNCSTSRPTAATLDPMFEMIPDSIAGKLRRQLSMKQPTTLKCSDSAVWRIEPCFAGLNARVCRHTPSGR
jgi:hypothetical protein